MAENKNFLRREFSSKDKNIYMQDKMIFQFNLIS
jgi:hypothetical protein